jgi:hypothetical protein
MKKGLLTFILLKIVLTIFSSNIQAQTTLGIQDFEASPATPTMTFSNTNGATSSGTNPGSGNPANANLFANGSQGWQAVNTTSTITFANVNISGYESCKVSFRLAGMSVNGTNGIDAADNATIEISLDNGSNWSSEVRVVGSAANQRWGFTATGSSTVTYDGDNTFTSVSSSSASGVSTVTINIPNGNTQVRARITLLNNDTNERWVIDDVKVEGNESGTSTLSTGATAEPSTISSLVDTNGEKITVFDFTVTDDAGSGGDADATQISQIVVSQGTGNDVSDWTKVIAYAELYDGINTHTTHTINTTNITFSSISNGVGNAGYIADNANKTYQVILYLKTDFGTEKTTADGKNLAFLVNNSSFTLESASSGFASSQSVESGASNNAITVDATKLEFVQQPTAVNVNDAVSPTVSVQATDVNGNRDLDYDGNTITLSFQTGCGTISGNTATATDGLAIFASLEFGSVQTNTVLTANGDGTPSVSNVNSTTFDVTGSTSETLVEWNFDDTNVTVDVNNSSNSGKQVSIVGVTYDGSQWVTGNPNTGNANSAVTWGNTTDEYWQIDLVTTNRTNLKFSYDMFSSATAPQDFKVQYSTDASAWTDTGSSIVLVTSTWNSVIDFTLPSACENQATLYLRWYRNSTVSANGGAIGTGGRNRIDNFKVTGELGVSSAGNTYVSAGSGDWNTACSWLVSGVTPQTYPTSEANTITILSGHTITINEDVTIDQLTIATGGTLILSGSATLTIANGTGADMIVNGTFEDNSSNAISFLSSATWQLGSDGTIIRKNNTGSTGYRDNYEGGMSTIPSTANWIIRYVGTVIPFTSGAATYYPNLTIESNSGAWNATSGSSKISGACTIKGNLDIGGTGSGTVIIYANNASAFSILGDLIVGSGSTFTNDNTSDGVGFSLTGNLTVEGTLINDANVGNLTLNRTSNQVISGSGTINLHDLTNSNTVGVTLSNSISLSGDLVFTSTANISTSNNVIWLSSSSSITGEDADSHVIGNVSQTKNVDVSTTVNFANGVTIADSPNNLGDVTVFRTSGDPNGITTVEGNSSIAALWDISPTTAPSGNLTLSLSWGSYWDNGRTSDLEVWKNDGEWKKVAAVTAAGEPRTASVTTNSFSSWTITDKNNPLPVSLVFFRGESLDSQAKLTWQTANEYQNKGFEILKSFNGIDFDSIGFVTGRGTSNISQNYSFIDNSFFQGAYYRLKQVDFEGTTEFSEVISISKVGENQNTFALFPNPITSQTQLVYYGVLDKDVQISIFDAQGKLIVEKFATLNQINAHLKNTTPYLLEGLYLIHIQHNQSLDVIKFVK